MRLLLFAVSVFLASTSLEAQREEINFDSFPNVTISVAPFNQSVVGTTNTFYVKSLVGKDEKKASFLRLGIGFLSALPNQSAAAEADVLSGRSAFSFNLGFENCRKVGNRMSFSLGLEFAYQRIAVSEALIAAGSGSMFSLHELEFISSPGTNRSSYRTSGLVFFTGFRYHINPHFQVGIESALGAGVFKLESSPGSNTFSNAPNISEDGGLLDFAAARNLVFEINF